MVLSMVMVCVIVAGCSMKEYESNYEMKDYMMDDMYYRDIYIYDELSVRAVYDEVFKEAIVVVDNDNSYLGLEAFINVLAEMGIKSDEEIIDENLGDVYIYYDVFGYDLYVFEYEDIENAFIENEYML